MGKLEVWATNLIGVCLTRKVLICYIPFPWLPFAGRSVERVKRHALHCKGGKKKRLMLTATFGKNWSFDWTKLQHSGERIDKKHVRCGCQFVALAQRHPIETYCLAK